MASASVMKPMVLLLTPLKRRRTTCRAGRRAAVAFATRLAWKR